MEQLVLLGVFGFLLRTAFLIKSKRSFAKQNNYEFVVIMLIWALPAYAIVEAIAFWAKTNDEILKFFHQNKNLIQVARMSVGVVISFLFAFIATRECIIKNYLSFLNNFPNENFKPQTSGLAEEDFLERDDLLLVSLKSGKIYIGALARADIKDSLDPDLKIIKLKLLYSIGRDKEGKALLESKIDYLSKVTDSITGEKDDIKDFLRNEIGIFVNENLIQNMSLSEKDFFKLSPDEKSAFEFAAIERILGKFPDELDGNSNNHSIDDENVRNLLISYFAAQKLPHISIFQREIVSYTTFNKSLFESFLKP